MQRHVVQRHNRTQKTGMNWALVSECDALTLIQLNNRSKMTPDRLIGLNHHHKPADSKLANIKFPKFLNSSAVAESCMCSFAVSELAQPTDKPKPCKGYLITKGKRVQKLIGALNT